MTHWNGREPEAKWWYNSRTGQVEEGPQSLAAERIGPFDTREEAERAPEIVAERARAWADEEAEEDDWRD